jgi:predicted secreted protein
MIQNAFKWQLAFHQALNVGVLADDPRGVFLLPRVNLYTTFAARLTVFTAGTVTVKLRFGLNDLVPITGYGVDFDALVAVNAVSLRSVGYAIGAAAPNVPGNPNSILPPVARVFITTGAGTQVTFQVFYACLGHE